MLIQNPLARMNNKTIARSVMASRTEGPTNNCWEKGWGGQGSPHVSKLKERTSAQERATYVWWSDTRLGAYTLIENPGGQLESQNAVRYLRSCGAAVQARAAHGVSRGRKRRARGRRRAPLLRSSTAILRKSQWAAGARLRPGHEAARPAGAIDTRPSSDSEGTRQRSRIRRPALQL